MIETFVIPAQPPIDPQERAKLLARSELQRTDYVVIKAQEGQGQPSSEWLAWRQQLREVVRGNLLNIPDEPARY
jgi:hypothetical protein